MNNKRPFSSEEFKEIYSKATRLCVELVIRTPGGIILSLRNLPSYYGKWHIPGGTVFYGERVIDAIKRIAREELDISVKVDRLLGYIEYNEEKERGYGWTVSVPFLCFSDGKNMKTNEDASEAKIFNKLPDNLIEEQRLFLGPIWNEISK